MELKTNLSLNEIRDQAETRINYLRGEEYYSQKRVNEVCLWKDASGSEQLSASIKGSKESQYITSVLIDGDGEVFDYECTCPVFYSSGDVCKHVVALLLFRYGNRTEKSYRMMTGVGPFDEEDDDETDFEEDEFEEEFEEEFFRGRDDDSLAIKETLDFDPHDRDALIRKLTEEVFGRTPQDQNGRSEQRIATDPFIKSLISFYSRDDLAKATAEGNVKAVPKLTISHGSAFLSITVGCTRQYVVKSMENFCSSMKGRLTDKYGKELEMVHHIDSFEPESQPLIRFIMKKQREKELLNPFGARDSYGYGYSYGSAGHELERDKRFLKLTPSAMDELFELLLIKDFTIGTDKASKAEDKTPPFYIEMKELPGKGGFSLTQPGYEHIYGDQYLYLCGSEGPDSQHGHNTLGSTLYRCDRDFSTKLQNFFAVGFGLRKNFVIAKQDMTSFYVNVLSELLDVVKLKGDTDSLKQFAPDELRVNLYLDSPLQNAVTACVKYQYGDMEIDAYDPGQKQDVPVARDERKERRVQLVIDKYFRNYDMQQKFLFIQGDDELLYHFLTEGTEEISKLGEVFLSDRFRNMSVRRPPQIAVGVRLESDLLHLEIDTKELPLNEVMDALQRYRQKRKFYRMKDGSFLKLDDADFSELAELVEGLGISEKNLSEGEVSIPKYRALHLDYLLKNSDHITFERNGNFKSLVKNMKAIEDSEFSVPESLAPIMRNYQKAGFRWLMTMDNCGFSGILADDMGLGKTLQIISMILSKKEEGLDCSTLVVCPASLVLNWQNEISKYAPVLNSVAVISTQAERGALLKRMEEFDVLITSYELLKRDIESYREKVFRYHIVDEAQYIKNHGTQNAKAVKAVRSKQRFALTGTPIENRLSELWSIFDFLMPDYLYTYKKFKDSYETAIVKNGDKEKVTLLNRQITPFVLRRMKANVLKELPDKVESVIYAQMEGEQKRLYLANLARAKADIGNKITEGGFENNKIMILALLTRLRQLCCHPSLCYEDYKEKSAKLEACIELMKEAVSGGHKVLLFSQFTTMLETIEKRLKAEGLSYYMLTGATPKSKRIELVDRFNADETQVFLISLKAGGTGLNLTGADIVIHFDPWWNVAAQNQATDRTHRIGQRNSVQVYKLIEKGTLEEKILKLQEIKKDLADTVVSDEMQGLQSLTHETLLALLES